MHFCFPRSLSPPSHTHTHELNITRHCGPDEYILHTMAMEEGTKNKVETIFFEVELHD